MKHRPKPACLGNGSLDRGLLNWIADKGCVYFITVKGPISYPRGQSSIVKIGQSKQTGWRVFESLREVLIDQEKKLKWKRNIGNAWAIHVVHVPELGHSRILESAFIYAFWTLYAAVPPFNTQGKHFTEREVEAVRKRWGMTLDWLRDVLKSIGTPNPAAEVRKEVRIPADSATAGGGERV